jgi:hypothetical protein
MDKGARRTIIDTSRTIMLEKFNQNYRAANAIYYPKNQSRNFYHDDLGTDGSGIAIRIFIEFSAPKKVVQQYGWYKEEDALPMLGYLPWYNNINPVKGDTFEVPATEGYAVGKWYINNVLMFGQPEAIAWAFNITRDRKAIL